MKARDNHVTPLCLRSMKIPRHPANTRTRRTDGIPIDPAARVAELFDKINPVFRPGSIVSWYQLAHKVPLSSFFSKFKDVIRVPLARDIIRAILSGKPFYRVTKQKLQSVHQKVYPSG